MDGFFMIGRVVRDIELRYTSKGTSVTNISLAVDRRYKKEGEEKPSTNFYEITTWGSLAENVSKYLVKGQLIAVSGHHDVIKVPSKDGTNISVPKLIADVVKFYNKPKTGSGNNADEKPTPTTDIFGNYFLPNEDIPF